MKGLDISHYQGTVNLSRVRTAGYAFVILKASEGTKYKDPTFDRNYKAARGAGLLVGAYHFATFTSPASARAEAKHFKTVLRGKKLDLIPQLDLEKNQAGSKLVACMQAFFEEIDRGGLYSMGYFYLNNLAGHHSQPLWYARYASKPIGVSRYAIWQHTSQARVPGIGGWVDENLTGPDWNSVLAASASVVSAPKSSVTVTPAPQTTPYYVTVAALNIRRTPNGKIIGLLKRGDRVQVISIASGWARLRSGDHSVYVASRYLSRTKPSASKPQAVTYTVKSGDTLSSIAARYKTTTANLAAINHISNPDRIYVGQRLTISGGATAKSSAVYVTVKRGDTVSELAHRYRSSIGKIKSLNHLNSKYVIFIGQKIRVK